MRTWLLIPVLLALASLASARTLRELFVDGQRSRLAALRDQVRVISAQKPQQRADALRLRELRKEIRQVEDGLKALDRRDAQAGQP